MKQVLTFYLDTLTAALEVREGDKDVAYTMRLSPDRESCNIVRTVFDDMEKGDPIAQEDYTRSLDALKNDGGLPHHLIWAARGMWGIPLEYGPTAEAEVEISLP